MATRGTIRPPRGYDLRTAVFGHGWIDLAPHSWNDRALQTALVVGDGDAIELRIRQRIRGGAITFSTDAGLSAGERGDARAAIRRVLRLDEDLGPFWQVCRERGDLAWVAERGAGYLMASPTVFEDLIKILFTTNCSWAATRGMVARLVDTKGPRSETGRRAFPDAAICARARTRFWKETVRCGYRSEAARSLARLGADGILDELADDPDLERRAARLAELPGFGPYAVGQARRLLGCRHTKTGDYRPLALDSWCRSRFAGLDDRAIARRFSPYGDYAGLAMWMELTRDWHDGKDPAVALGG